MYLCATTEMHTYGGGMRYLTTTCSYYSVCVCIYVYVCVSFGNYTLIFLCVPMYVYVYI